MVGTLFRIVSGFVLACVAAGLAKVAFAYAPSELLEMPPEIAWERLALVWPIATHHAIFSAPFALIAVWLGEWRGWRDWAYYAAVAMAIALLGFFAQYFSENDQLGWSVVDSHYPLVAFLSSGFVAGLVYWLTAGRLAGAEHGASNSHSNSGQSNGGQTPASTSR